jgi:Fic/DOC family
MPKLIDANEAIIIAKSVARHIEGVTLSVLHFEFTALMSRRTLLRRLGGLIDDGRVEARGTGRATRYFAKSPTLFAMSAPAAPFHVAEPPPRPYAARAATKPDYVTMSKAGEEIRAYIRQPRQQRKPVGYAIEFLEAYAPNARFYLPESLREQLHSLGRSSMGETPAGTFARDILNRLLIDLSWASSRLEGNTYSRLDTERLIEFGQAAEGKDATETQMILNHKAAIEYLVLNPANARLSADTIIALHALLSDGLMADPLACGRIRRRAVDIGGSVYLPLAMPQQLEELFGYVVNMAEEIADPFEQSFFLMVHLPYLQPFEDVNKRVSRLAANIPFIQRNLCPLSFVDVPQQAYVDAVLGVYETNRVDLLRDVFVWAYERSCQQYVAVKQQLVPPDTFRLRHRDALNTVMATLIRGGLAPTDANALAHLPASVPDDERSRFVALVLREFTTIHAGNVVRFGLRPLEFEAWRKAITSQ